MDEQGAARSWELADCEQMNAQHPRSFFIPPRSERESLRPGQLVKLIFELRERQLGLAGGERMWVQLTGAEAGRYIGRLDNRPAVIRDLELGSLVSFGPEHIATIWSDEEPPQWSGKRAMVNRRTIEQDVLPKVAHREDPVQEDDSGWMFMVGDESDAELDDKETYLLPQLGWYSERYPHIEALMECSENGGYIWDASSGSWVRQPDEQ